MQSYINPGSKLESNDRDYNPNKFKNCDYCQKKIPNTVRCYERCCHRQCKNWRCSQRCKKEAMAKMKMLEEQGSDPNSRCSFCPPQMYCPEGWCYHWGKDAGTCDGSGTQPQGSKCNQRKMCCQP